MSVFFLEELPELDTGALDVAIAGARLFLESRGYVSLSEWRALGPEDRLALHRAAIEVDAAEAMLEPSSNPEQVALRLARLDGGQLYQRLRLRAAVTEVARGST